MPLLRAIVVPLKYAELAEIQPDVGLGENPRIGDSAGDPGAIGPLQEGDEELAGEPQSLPEHWRCNWPISSEFPYGISKKIQ